MRNFFAKAGVETDRIRDVPGRRPGLYAITLKKAERAFTYWRGESAARLLADDAAWLKRALSGAEMLYFSGITLAILAPAARRRLLARARGTAKGGRADRLRSEFSAGALARQKGSAGGDGGGLPRRRHRAPDIFGRERLFGDRRVEDTAKRMARRRRRRIRHQERRQAGGGFRRWHARAKSRR